MPKGKKARAAAKTAAVSAPTTAVETPAVMAEAPKPKPAAAPAVSRWPLIVAVLAGLGLAISLYLTVIHYTSVPLVCIGGVKGCEEVNRSIYSEVAGVAVALLGAGGYLGILLSLWAVSQRIVSEDEGALAVFGLSLLGVLYSAYLTYIELFVLQAVCSWCVLSALILAAIFALSLVRLRERLSSYRTRG